MEPGNHTLPLPFDGALVFDSGADGPYRVERIRLEEADTGLTLDLIESYTTAAYAHTDFLRPLCLLTGQATDYGESNTGSPPYAKLVVEIEVDSLVEAPVRAQAKLYATDGTFIGGRWIFVTLSPGLNMVAFEFDAAVIFRAGHAGPYTLRLLTLWGTADGGAPVSLRVAGPVAVTRPYALDDFASPSTHTVGGTVTGLIGTALTLTDKAVFLDLRPGDGAFAFTLPRTVGSRYDVQVTRHPAGPVQVCTIANGAGVVGATDVTDIEVHCGTPVPQDGLDPTFGGGKVAAAHSAPTGMTLQGDGRILVVGGRTLARYLPDGAPDPTFGAGGIVTVSFGPSPLATANAVAVAHDGRILVAGYTPLGTHDLALARYADTGAPDTGFGTGGLVTTDFHGGTDQAWSVLVQPDHKIVLVGNASTGPPVPANDFAAARYLDTGKPDPDFGDGGKVMTDIAGGSDLACAAVLQPDGKIVAVGRVATSGGTDPDFGLVRYTVDGVPDPDFGAAGVVRTDFGITGWVQPTDLALTGNGEIVVVGRVGTSPAVFAVARFDHTGTPDPGFGNGGLVTTPIGTGDAVANAVAVQADGKLVVAGYAFHGGPADFTVVRYTAGGVPDITVTVDFYGADDRADCMAIQPDGGIVVAGSAVNVRTTGLGMARLLA